jgi:RimJ/RimL family protein N-acetyltransferase
VIETERLILRRFRDEDIEPYAAMMADPRVADWLGGVRSRARCEANLHAWADDWARLGYGLLAITRKADGIFIGMAGLHTLDASYNSTPVAGATEIAWRLAFRAWGQGYAVEAARAVVADGFERVGLREIVALTAQSNLRSQTVMARSGFLRQAHLDFHHPNLPPGHALRRHVVSAISKC